MASAGRIFTLPGNRPHETPALSPQGSPDGYSLRIALTADPELPVPPRLYGGIERVVDMLTRGLEDRGHHVTLFAHSASSTGGRLVAWPGTNSRSTIDTLRNATTLARETFRGRFDLVHSFSRIAYLAPILPLSIPKLMTYQRVITARTVGLSHALSRGTLQFTGISRSDDAKCRGRLGGGRWFRTAFRLDSVCFWAVMSRPTLPLEIVSGSASGADQGAPPSNRDRLRRTGMRLVMAGNVPDAHRAWFDAHVAPHIDDQQVRYVGPVDDRQKRANSSARHARF